MALAIGWPFFLRATRSGFVWDNCDRLDRSCEVCYLFNGKTETVYCSVFVTLQTTFFMTHFILMLIAIKKYGIKKRYLLPGYPLFACVRSIVRRIFQSTSNCKRSGNGNMGSGLVDDAVLVIAQDLTKRSEIGTAC